MAENTPVPWKEGFFTMGPIKAIILQTSGSNQLKMKNLVALDYPDLEAGSTPLECNYGDFGEAKKEIADATGVKNNNIRVHNSMMDFKGVLNEEGNKMTMWGLGNAMEEWVWLDGDAIEEHKKDRDDFEAPR